MSWPSAALVLVLLSATDTASARPERQKVEVQADGAAKPHEGRTLRVETAHAPPQKKKPVPPTARDRNAPLSAAEELLTLPPALRHLMEVVLDHEKRSHKNSASERNRRNVKFKSRDHSRVVTLPTYVLTTDTPSGSARRARIAEDYGPHFGLPEDGAWGRLEWERLWFYAVPPDLFADQDGDSQRYKIKAEFDRAFAAGVERYLTLSELSHYVSILAFLWSVVADGHEHAFLLEDDFNFIPIVDNSVFQKGALVPWAEVATPVEAAQRQYGYSAADFQARFVNSIRQLDEQGPRPELLYVGSLYGTDDNIDLASRPEVDAEERSFAVQPRCVAGTHALVVSSTGARKLLHALAPVWLRVDAALHRAPIVAAELVPNLVGQGAYWNVYKKMPRYSSLAETAATYTAASARAKIALGVCIPAWDSQRYYAAVAMDLWYGAQVYLVIGAFLLWRTAKKLLARFPRFRADSAVFRETDLKVALAREHAFPQFR